MNKTPIQSNYFYNSKKQYFQVPQSCEGHSSTEDVSSVPNCLSTADQANTSTELVQVSEGKYER